MATDAYPTKYFIFSNFLTVQLFGTEELYVFDKYSDPAPSNFTPGRMNKLADWSLYCPKLNASIMNVIEYPPSITPVSYTHLDVYKRQELISRLKRKLECTSLDAMTVTNFI